jgi:c-di-GMP-binding flagellar brake protein YcgR
MSFAIELNERQSNRILEQAMRRQAEILIEARSGSGDGPITGEIVPDNSGDLALSVKNEPNVLLENLIGVYVEGHIQMGECRYLFSTHVIDVAPNEGHGKIVLRRPSVIMVIQRRRFWRTRYAESSDVEISYEVGSSRQTVFGGLCNISPDGLAVLVSTRLAEGMLIGETVRTQFELPGLNHLFKFDAILCNKTPGGDKESIILGLQFANPERSEKSLAILRNHLRGAGRIPADRGTGE